MLSVEKKLSRLNSFYLIALFLAAIIPGYSCSDIPSNTSTLKDSTAHSPKVIRKPGSSFNDTLIISQKSAIFYTADSLQSEKIKTVNEKSIFESLEHDCLFQMMYARKVFNAHWKQITIIENSRARFLLFLKKNKTRTIIDLNAENDICGIFLFDGENEPELADMMNIDTALGFYFNK